MPSSLPDLGQPPCDGKGIGQRHVLGEGQGPARQEAAPAEDPDAPPIARVELEAPGVDLGEPSGGVASQRAEAQDLPHRGASGHLPDRVAPREAVPGGQDEALVDGVGPDVGEVHSQRRAAAAAAARADGEVRPPPGVPEPVRIHRHVDPRADEGATPLVLVDRDVDAVLQQDGEGALHAVPGHQVLEVPERASGEPEELAVGAPVVLVDGPSHQREEAGLPVRETMAERGPGLLGGDRGAKERGQRPQEPRSDEDVVQLDQWTRTSPRAARSSSAGRRRGRAAGRRSRRTAGSRASRARGSSGRARRSG